MNPIARVMKERRTTALVQHVWGRVRPPRQDLLVLAVSVVVLVLLTADVVAGGLLTYVDEAISGALPSSDDAPAWTGVVGLAGNVGVGATVVVLLAIVTMHARMRWWPGVMAFTQLAVTGVVVGGLKYAVGRDGPSQDAAPDGYPGFFPSGHTATAVVSVGIVVFLLSTWRSPVATARRRGLVAGGVAGVVVGASTVIGGYHWMTDSLAGLAVAAPVLVVGFGMTEAYLAGPRPRTRR